MSRLVVALFGPSGAGKTTIARASGLTIYDRDDPPWNTLGEGGFRRAIAKLRHDPTAQAVVIRAGATSTARAGTLRAINATHAYLVVPDEATCHQQAGHRGRGDAYYSHGSIKRWYAGFDHTDGVPHWPGEWGQVWDDPGLDGHAALTGDPMPTPRTVW